MRILPAILAAAVALPVAAAEVSAQLNLTIPGDAEVRTVSYDCEGIPSFDVRYINAAPNFLAIIPVQEQTYVFTATLAASGVRYVSGSFAWWTKGSDADWYDLTNGEDAPPTFSCTEHNRTP